MLTTGFLCSYSSTAISFSEVRMGISRDHWHKRRATGGKRTPIRKKRKFELARPAAMTKLAPQRIHTLRVRGGNKKYRALRLDQGRVVDGILRNVVS